MTEKQLIAKIRQLRQIKPRQDWVIFTKERIFNEKPVSIRRQTPVFSLNSLIRVFQPKFAFAPLVVLIVLAGAFAFAQDSLPGDMLFPLKRIVEKSQAVFLSEKEQPKRDIELANKRLDELTKIAESNQTQKLGAAISEVQASVSKVAKNLKGIKPDAVKEAIKGVKEIEEKTQKIKSLGVKIEENEELKDAVALSEALDQIGPLIDDLRNSTLTEEQQDVFKEIEAEYKAGNYSKVIEGFERFLLLSQ